MAVTDFQDYDLASADREWDGDEAERRIRKWANAEDGPNEKYRNAHIWYDSDKPDNFGSHKMLIADVVNGKIKAVPRGIAAAAAVLDGARGGVNIPKHDADQAKLHLAKYYGKLNEAPPWEK